MLMDIVAVICLLFLSGLFSGSETAILNLNRITLPKIQKLYPDRFKIIKRIFNNLHAFLITILVANTIVNIIISSISTQIFTSIFHFQVIFISILITTIYLLLLGEITPKIIALRLPYKFNYNTCYILWVFYKVFFPLRIVLERLSDIFLKVFLGKEYKKERINITEEELKTILELSLKEGIVDKKEKEMIRSVLEFQDTQVSQIMTPRVDIHAVPIDMNQKDLLQFLKTVKHSKIPVYEDSLDKIIGVIYAKDIFLNPAEDFRRFIKEPKFVPEAKRIDQLLKEFHETGERIAIVVDEYGGTAGLVSLEDILEEIFGEIYDEFEFRRENIELLEPNKWRVLGRTSIKEINQKLNLNLKEENDTIAGLILERLGKIPQSGQTVEFGDFNIIIEKTTVKRIVSLIFIKK